MTTFTAWKFDTADGAQKAAEALKARATTAWSRSSTTP